MYFIGQEKSMCSYLLPRHPPSELITAKLSVQQKYAPMAFRIRLGREGEPRNRGINILDQRNGAA